MGFHQNAQALVIPRGFCEGLAQLRELDNDRILKAVKGDHAVKQVISVVGHFYYLLFFSSGIIIA